MALRTAKRSLSRLFKSEVADQHKYPEGAPYSPPPEFYAESPSEPTANSPVDSPTVSPVVSRVVPPAKTPDKSPAELCLKLTKNCMEQADKMTSFWRSPPPRFNHEQCKYLSYKLTIAVQNAHSFFEQIKTWYSILASPADMVRSLEIFELLFALSKEVESFIQSCCKDEWVQSAITLTNGLEHVTSICFNLELCTIVFSKKKNLGATPSLTVTEVASVRQMEAEIVKKMANIDEGRLCEGLSPLSRRTKFRSNTEIQLATFLHDRLNIRRLHPGSDSSGSFQSFSHSEIKVGSMKQKERLGKGSSGTVHKAMWLGAEVAKKTFHGPDNPEFVQEVSILAGLCHPNIVYMFGYMRDEHKCHIIMELMDGDLYTLMQERLEEFGSYKPPFTIPEAAEIMLQVAEAVYFLHEKKIVHRDLKSHNILVRHGKATNGEMKYMQVKVADFGLSKTKERSMTYSDQTPNMGTTRWMAPEMMKNVGQEKLLEDEVLKYPRRSDVYSFGMVCYEILTGHLPFSTLNNNEVKKVVLRGDHPPLPHQCPSTLRALIEACWSFEASKRPDIGKICAELRQMKFEHLYTSALADVPRCFSFDEITRMTNGFRCEQEYLILKVYNSVMDDTGKVIVVEKGFMPLSVFKGGIVDTGDVVLVERGYDDNSVNQIKVLVGLDHNNLVRCVGFCSEESEWILVFEGMPNGSLGDWLDEHEGDVNYKWPVRKKICIGVANGIHYLHAVCIPRIIHHNLNPQNILLDTNLEPKITGCGRRRSDKKYHWPYYPPECRSGQLICEKVDVYCYGVLLRDIVHGSTKSRYNREWAWELHCNGRTKDIIDPCLHLQPNEEMEALRIIKIALLCMQNVPERRPDMSLVVAMLQGKEDAKISSLLLEREKELSG